MTGKTAENPGMPRTTAALLLLTFALRIEALAQTKRLTIEAIFGGEPISSKRKARAR